MTSAVQESTTRGGADAAHSAPAGAEAGQFLTFMLGSELYAIGILAIKEIIEYHAMTQVPMMPPCVRGVINLRGAVVPVMDLLARFGRASSAVTKRSCIVIVEVDAAGQRQVIGLIVDAVNEVLDIAAADIEPAPAFGSRIRSEFIHGMGKVRGNFVILLDVDRALSFDDIAALAAPGAPEEAELAH